MLQHTKTIQLLLEHGQNPNDEYSVCLSKDVIHKETPWALLVSLLIHNTRGGMAANLLPQFESCLRAGMLGLFVHHGANPNALVYRRETRESTIAWIDILFACYKVSETCEEHYLCLLEALLRGDISVDGATPYLSNTNKVRDRPISETILKRFFHSVRPLGRSIDFIFHISELVMRTACVAGWSLDTVQSNMQKAFGVSRTRHLMKVYHGDTKLTHAMPANGDGRVKRPFPWDVDKAKECKRWKA
ncbi:hypothetical protein EV127DRAFT_503090 [Xylaria flabelliformis]|nr:hypothetical protein EV127DRAFT_503090 [Xylaria flabelliformis]